MESNKIIQPSQYSINNSAKPAIQMQNYFRIDHNTKIFQNQNKLNSKNNGTHQYEIYLSSRSKSKERESDNSYINKPKIILNNLPPEFNISKNNIMNNNCNSKEKMINNYLLGTKTDMDMKIKIINNNKTNSSTNIHYKNLSSTSNELIVNNKKNIINKIKKKNTNNNINNHFRTEGSEFEATTTKENTKNIGNANNTSTGFKSFNISNIKNGGKTLLKYDKIEYNNNTNLSEIEEILIKKKDKDMDKIQKKKLNYKQQKENKENMGNISGMDKKISNIAKNGIKPIKLNNYNYSNNYQRKVIPPIMNKNDKIIFDSESLFSIKKTQISNINNINYSKIQKNNKSNSNLNLLEQQGKTFTNFKNDIKLNYDGDRRSLPVKNINNNATKKNEKSKVSRPNSEDNNKINYEINNTNINEKDKFNKRIEELIISKKVPPKDLNKGIFFKYRNGYKYYFDLNRIDCYLLMEISDNDINSVEEWNTNYRKCKNYLKIIGYQKYDVDNSKMPHYYIVIEHPIGGENFYDIINSIGFYDIKLLLNISQTIYECLSIIKNDKSNMNIIFCLCDIFLNANNHIKIIPPFVRYINNKFSHSYCECKKFIFKIINLFNYDKKNTSLVCFGICLIQLITQNLLFKMSSFNYLINNDAHINNITSILKYKKCCFIHTILNIESNLFDNKNDLLLAQFIKLYPNYVTDFIHICTQFNYDENYDKIYKHEFLNIYDISNHIEIYFKELLKIITLDQKNNQNDITYESFLEKFKKIYEKLDINSYVFFRVLHHKKILNTLNRAFNTNKSSDIDKLLKIIERKESDII